METEIFVLGMNGERGGGGVNIEGGGGGRETRLL